MIPSEERSTAVGEVWWVQWAVPGKERRGQEERPNYCGYYNATCEGRKGYLKGEEDEEAKTV